MKIAVSIFKFFASLKLAIFLLLALASVFSVGTFVESLYGTEAAKLIVYGTLWLNLLLILLALNVLAAALDRLPWKKKHVGFVITHAGILLILTGSLVTRAYGIEGQMAIREGQTLSHLILNEGRLQLITAGEGLLASYEIPQRAFPWKGLKRLFPSTPESTSLPRVSLLRYYPKASQEEKIQSSSNGPAALRVVLESSWMRTSHWLLLDDPRRSQVLLGPAELAFTRERIQLQKEPGTQGHLEFRFENTTVTIPLGEANAKKILLEGTPYQVSELRILRDALVDQGRLLDRSEDWNNPACEFILEGNGIQERHTVFSKFPDFPTMHGMKPSQTGARIYYSRPEGESMGPKNELRFVWQEGQMPLYQIRKGEEISGGTLEVGKDYGTGWMDFKFRVEAYYPHARLDTGYTEEPVQSESEEHLSAVEIELEGEGERKSFWLGQGEKQNVLLGRESYEMIYGLRLLPLGFRIGLRDFRVENYPGTNRPASFESDVTLQDDSRGISRELTIRMNRPLKHRGFKVFQSGYQQPEGGPEVSIFTVARDPGIPVKYAGAVVLIGGILTMFYTRRFSNRANQEIKEALLIR